MFRCKVCGWIHEGVTPPDACPSCGSPPDRFRAMTEAEVGYVTTDMASYGVAGQGFDDIEVAKMLTPPLTTVRNSGTELGRVAFKRLLGMIRGDTPESDAAIKWTIPMRIIERQSVRKL